MVACNLLIYCLSWIVGDVFPNSKNTFECSFKIIIIIRDKVSLGSPSWPRTSFTDPGWPWTYKFSYFCLPSARIKAMCHNTLLSSYYSGFWHSDTWSLVSKSPALSLGLDSKLCASFESLQGIQWDELGDHQKQWKPPENSQIKAMICGSCSLDLENNAPGL